MSPAFTRYRPGHLPRHWTQRGQRLAAEGLRRGLEHTLAVSNSRVPLDEGTLMRTGRVDMDKLGGSISYDTVYAARQHEELTWKHAPGRQAKYLESAMNDTSDEVLAMMAVSLRRWLRG